MRGRSALAWYAGAVCVLAVVLAALCAWHAVPADPGSDARTSVLLGLATVLAGLLPVPRTSRDRCDPPFPLATVLAFAVVLLSPLTAVLALLVAMGLRALLRRPGLPLLLHTAAAVVALLTARAVFAGVTGVPYAASSLTPDQLPAVALAGVFFLGITVLLLAPVIAPPPTGPLLLPPLLSAQAVPWLRWSGSLAAASAPYLADIALAPLAIVAGSFSPWLLIPALMVLALWHRRPQSAEGAEHEALHDAATGLPNRALFHLRFEAFRHDDTPLAVMLVECYETAGGVGLPLAEDVPLLVAERLRQTLRKGDNLARLDERTFGLIARLDAASPLREAERLARRIVSGIAEMSPSTGVGARLGMSLAPLHGTSAEVLMSHAETALERATEGQAQWHTYDAVAHEGSPERSSLLEELRDGLERDQLELRYQPKLDLRTNVVVGVEALARWRHPRRGLLGPAEFIPLAESGGLIAPLTLPLLDKALAQTAQWRERGWQLNVAVNLSATHLADLRLPTQVADALRRHDVPGELLTLEVTESTIMSDPERAIQVLRELRTQGVRTSIDDYGTGYSSLAFLRQLQVDELKIDASFIRHLASADADELIVASTIELAHNLGLRVVAEGVEDLDAWRRLTSLQCDVVQGYLLSPPQRGEELTAWLTERRVAGTPERVPPTTPPATPGDPDLSAEPDISPTRAS